MNFKWTSLQSRLLPPEIFHRKCFSFPLHFKRNCRICCHCRLTCLYSWQLFFYFIFYIYSLTFFHHSINKYFLRAAHFIGNQQKIATRSQIILKRTLSGKTVSVLSEVSAISSRLNKRTQKLCGMQLELPRKTSTVASLFKIMLHIILALRCIKNHCCCCIQFIGQ